MKKYLLIKIPVDEYDNLKAYAGSSAVVKYSSMVISLIERS
jgi:hypothetical protein